MAQDAAKEPRPWAGFSVVWMLDTSVSAWLATAPVWLPVALVAFLPWVLLQLWWIEQLLSDGMETELTRGLRVCLGAVSLLGASAVTSAVSCYAVVRKLEGGGLAFRESLRRGIARLPHALGIGVTFVAMGVALSLVAAVVMVRLAPFAGTLAALLPLWLLVVWGLALPAAVTERLPVVASLRRSAALTRGRRVRLVWAWVALLVCLWIVVGVLLGLSGGRRDVATTREEWRSEHMRHLGSSAALLGLTCTLMAVSVGVAYFGLRREKDGATFGELVKAFE